MTFEKIKEKLEKAIENLEKYKNNYEMLYPLILKDLYYVLKQVDDDAKELSSVDNFMHGVDIVKLQMKYIAELTSIYVKYMYKEDVIITEDHENQLQGLATGAYDEKQNKIYYNFFGSLLNKKGNLNFLHTCLHEVRHYIQYRNFYETDFYNFDPKMLIILKEIILLDCIKDNNEFYTENYKITFSENDAEIFAFEELTNFINNLHNLYLKQTRTNLNLEGEKDILISIFKEEIKKETSSSFDKNVVKQIKEIKNIMGDYTLNGEKKDKLILLDKNLKNHPELQGKYPILKLLFNGNNPKTYEEIIHDIEVIKVNKTKEQIKKIEKLYEYIIETDPVLALKDRFKNQKYSAANVYLMIHPSIQEEYSKEAESISDKIKQMKK